MVIASDIKFTSTLNPEQLENYIEDTTFDVSVDGVEIPKFEWFKQDFFESELDELYEFCRDVKAKVKGNIFLVRKDGDDGEPIQHHVKLGSKEYDFNECSFSISVRKSGEKRKTLTQDEKVALFKEYWDKKHQIPPPKEVYKDFKLGMFYNQCKKNGDLLQLMENIQNDKE